MVLLTKLACPNLGESARAHAQVAALGSSVHRSGRDRGRPRVRRRHGPSARLILMNMARLLTGRVCITYKILIIYTRHASTSAIKSTSTENRSNTTEQI